MPFGLATLWFCLGLARFAAEDGGLARNGEVLVPKATLCLGSLFELLLFADLIV